MKANKKNIVKNISPICLPMKVSSSFSSSFSFLGTGGRKVHISLLPKYAAIDICLEIKENYISGMNQNGSSY